MKFVLTEGHFATEDEAFAEIEARGWHAMALDMVCRQEEFHWHDFDSVIFVVRGTAAAQYQDGTVEEAAAGTRVEAPAGIVHHDVEGTTYRAVFGFSVAPAEMTQPLNKLLPVSI